MSDLDEFQRRVEAYFQCGQRQEPAGRLILDLMHALRVANPPINAAYIQDTEKRLRREIELLRKNDEQLRTENEQLRFQREGLLCRVAELRAEIELVSK